MYIYAKYIDPSGHFMKIFEAQTSITCFFLQRLKVIYLRHYKSIIIIHFFSESSFSIYLKDLLERNSTPTTRRTSRTTSR